MGRFRKKPVEVEATQWQGHGDDLNVRQYDGNFSTLNRRCPHCHCTPSFHGWIDTLEGGHIVCVGDFIITGVKGEHYPCKPEIFYLTYEDVEAPRILNNDYAIEVEASKLMKLEDDALLLECLRAGGVDNWDWYGEALDAFNKIKEKESGKL